jgi:hypothetical protein
MTTSDVREIALGSCLVSLLDPTPGQEVAFHRWYERDHFYAGCLIGPWFFAGRRFVATGPLKDLRFPEQTPVLDDVRRGSYLALYWILGGHHDEAERWAVARVNQLIANDRMLPSRRPAHAGFYRHRWSAFRDPDGVPAELALDHPYAGAALVMIDREPDTDLAALESFFRDQQLPRLLSGSPASMCLGFEPIPLPDAAPAYVTRASGRERRSLLISFLEEDPRGSWEQLFRRQARELSESGLARVVWAAPFIPTLPGTDRYTDELW